MKASKICCPCAQCPVIVEESADASVVDLFDEHLEKHGLCLDADYKADLHARIVYIRDTGMIPRIDPFIVVPLDVCSAI